MKKFDPNNFIIDKVFKSIDKTYKLKNKKKLKKNKEKTKKVVEETTVDKSVDDGVYTIEINM